MGDAVRPEATRVVPVKVRVPAPSGLMRSRLHDRLHETLRSGFGVVVGPAGSGKTTVLSQFVGSVGAPVAWLRAEHSEGAVAPLLAYLEHTLGQSLPALAGGWGSLEEMVTDLEGWSGERAVLVVDDFHVLEGTPAEPFVEQLVEYAPPSLVVLLASRRQPRFNLSRRRVAGTLTEIGANDLRFRSWEVERLFKDCYGEPLFPDEVGDLTNRTGGWPAVLQLFHLATRGQTAARRRQTLLALSSRSSLVREYLTQNVLEGLPAELRRFLLETSVLPRVSGALCDELLGEHHGQQRLAEIERRQMLLVPLDDGGYRYHEVFRSYLEAVLVDEVGETEMRARCRRAGEVLERTGAFADAIRAYSRAGDHEAIARLLRTTGEAAVTAPGAWIEALPAGVVDSDPWLVLARARRRLACGRATAAIEDYRSAERAFGKVGGATTAQLERMAVTAWLEPLAPAGGDWSGAVRQATKRDPLGVAAGPTVGEPADVLGTALALLLAGHVRDANRALARLAATATVSPLLALAAQFANAVGRCLAGERPLEQLVACEEGFEELGLPWLAMLCQATLDAALDPEAAVEETRADDPWGDALVRLLRATIGSCPVPADGLRHAAEVFRRLGAHVLEAWAAASEALQLAEAGDPGAHVAALAAERLARTTGARGATVTAYRALALTDPTRAAEHLGLAAAVAEECGLAAPPAPPDVVGDGPATNGSSANGAASTNGTAAVAVTCFGDFTVTVGGETIDLLGVKPRARSLLRLLAMNPGRLVHREELIEALWPEVDPAAGKRSLQVAISALRQLIDVALVARIGDAYCLTLPAEATVDFVRFDRLLADARAADGAGDADATVETLEAALDLYRGDLLPEEGPAEWVVKGRDRFRAAAADGAERLARIRLSQDALPAAVGACQRGLAIDRYRDAIWRMLIEAYRRSGDHAAAAHAQQEYDAVLHELGVDTLAAT